MNNFRNRWVGATASTSNPTILSLPSTVSRGASADNDNDNNDVVNSEMMMKIVLPSLPTDEAVPAAGIAAVEADEALRTTTPSPPLSLFSSLPPPLPPLSQEQYHPIMMDEPLSPVTLPALPPLALHANDDGGEFLCKVIPASAVGTSIIAPPVLANASGVAINKACSHDNCTRWAQQRGLCVRHGAKKATCSTPGCTNHVQQRGVCIAHGALVRRCTYPPGCTNKAKQGGRCIRHGAKVERKLCTHISGCTNFAQRGGLCKQHGAPVKLCMFDGGCTNKVNKGGLCRRHGLVIPAAGNAATHVLAAPVRVRSPTSRQRQSVTNNKRTRSSSSATNTSNIKVRVKSAGQKFTDLDVLAAAAIIRNM